MGTPYPGATPMGTPYPGIPNGNPDPGATPMGAPRSRKLHIIKIMKNIKKNIKNYEKSNLLINLFLVFPGSFLTAKINRKLNFAFICLIPRFLGAGRCSFMPGLCLGSHWGSQGLGFPLGLLLGQGSHWGSQGMGFPLGRSRSGPRGPLALWDPPKDPGPLGPP